MHSTNNTKQRETPPSVFSITRDFEFFTFDERETTSPSPADELFYKGKLLPLYFPPRRKMVEHLLCTTKTAPCTTANTPSDSCNISPSESCRPSCDLNPSDNFFEWLINLWSKKLIKHLILAQKLKSSRAYLRSLFKNGADESGNRRSFSGAIKRHSPTKCLSSSSSSSSSSFNSSGLRVKFLRRSSSSNEIEGSINAAIAHCKKSMQTDDSKISASSSSPPELSGCLK